MKNSNTVAIHFFLLLFVSSCTRSLVCNVTNNSGLDIKVYSYDTKQNCTERVIATGTSADVFFPTTLKITAAEHIWNYDWKGLHPVEKFARARFLGPLEVKVQIEPQGVIYILDPSVKAPTSQLSIQPQGFPLKPK